MQSRTVSAVVLAIVLGIGCGSKQEAVTFKDKGEELRYLESLSNPSVDQFRRREELRDEAAHERYEREFRASVQDRQAKINRLMSQARDYETRKIWTLAAEKYNEVSSTYYGSPEAKEANAFLERYEAMKNKEK